MERIEKSAAARDRATPSKPKHESKTTAKTYGVVEK